MLLDIFSQSDNLWGGLELLSLHFEVKIALCVLDKRGMYDLFVFFLPKLLEIALCNNVIRLISIKDSRYFNTAYTL